MLKNLLTHIFFSLLFVVNSLSGYAQKVQEPSFTKPGWTKPYKPFKIAGNLYYVGTYELACYLISTPQGHILINTGTAASATQILHNIQALGFKPKDVKIITTMQVHYDHVGAMAAIKKATGARVMVDEKDAAVLADGGLTDYEYGGKNMLFAPVQASRLLQDKDTISIGGTQLVMLHHPGHTKGSCSFLFTVADGQQNYCVLLANMPSIITERKFADVTQYPNIAGDYAYTFKAMKSLHFDIWLAAHASQCNLHTKHKTGDAYNPLVFADKQGYDDALAELENDFNKKLRAEQQ